MTMRHLLITTLILAVSGCAKAPTYAEKLSARPLPSTQSEVLDECQWIRSEIARKSSGIRLLQTRNFVGKEAAVVGVHRQIALLEDRAARLRCGAAFSPQLPLQSNKIEQCINACRSNTARSAEQCFDDCNK